MKLFFYCAFFCAFNIYATENVKYKISSTEVFKNHQKATAIFNEIAECGFENDLHVKKLQAELRAAYEQALEYADGLDRAFILRRYASALWRLKHLDSDYLHKARSLMHEALYIWESGEKPYSAEKDNELFYGQALFDDIRINLSNKSGERALSSSNKLLDLDPNIELSLFAVRSLFTLYFARGEFDKANQYLGFAKDIEKNCPTDLRNEAKIVLVNKDMPLEKRLKVAENLVWQSYDINKRAKDQNNREQLIQDIILLFSIRMSNEQLLSNNNALSVAFKWINQADFLFWSSAPLAKRKLISAAMKMLENQNRPLSKQYYELLPPAIQINASRLEEIKPFFLAWFEIN